MRRVRSRFLVFAGFAILVAIRPARALVQSVPRQPATAAQPSEDGYRANNRGVALLEQYRFDAALAELQKAVALLPRYAQARINLAIAQLYAPDLAAARRSAEQAASLDPRSPQPPYLLGLIARADGRADDAIRELERVRAENPRFVAGRLQLGLGYYAAGRREEAATEWRAVLASAPGNRSARMYLSLVEPAAPSEK